MANWPPSCGQRSSAPRGTWGDASPRQEARGDGRARPYPDNARTPRRPVAPVGLRAVPLAHQHVRDTVLDRATLIADTGHVQAPATADDRRDRPPVALVEITVIGEVAWQRRTIVLGLEFEVE